MEYASGLFNTRKTTPVKAVDGFSLHPVEPCVAIRKRDSVLKEDLSA
jgi:hypothetical protein